jgi:hypothetical protein
VTKDRPAVERFEVVTVPAGIVRRAVTTAFSVLSLTSASATLPQWHRYEIRDRQSGERLRTVNDDVNGRDVGSELQRTLGDMTASDFARRWKLPASA